MSGFAFSCSLDRGRFKLEVDLQVPDPAITALFGPSGAGKTTVLQVIAGLLRTDRAMVQVAGQTWQDANFYLAPHHRRVGYIFQGASLLPHLSARDNLQFVMRRTPIQPQQTTYEHLVSLLDIEPVMDTKPDQLSGGERQRVALACAVLRQPDILLLDEPLSGLDAPRKSIVLPYIKALHSEFSIPILYVSHDVDEIAQLADRLVVLDDGQLVANGPLQETFARLAPPYQSRREQGVVINGTVAELDTHWHISKVSFPGGELQLNDVIGDVGTQVRIRILARDVSIALTRQENTSIANRLPVEVANIAADDAATCLIELRCGEQIILSRITRRSAAELNLAQGQHVWMQVKTAAVVR